MSAAAPMLEVDRVSAGYGAVQALDEVSLQVMPGEIVTLIGANGAGKSTLLMTICGAPKPRSGSIRLAGEDITGAPTHAIMRRGVAQSPEGRRIFPRMTVQENLLMGAEALTRDDPRPQMEQAFTLFPRLKERIHQQAGTLSGGEQQMLAVARALMLAPRLMLLDEPSFGLAPLIVQEIFRILRRINEDEKVSMLIVEQNAALALELADHVYLLETGRVVMSGPSAMVKNDETLRKAYLGY